jgi:hypothetical protein
MAQTPVSRSVAARPLAIRRRERAGSGAPEALGLLPLLDVLTATIGVFVSIVAFQVFGSVSAGGEPRADLLVIVEADDTYSMFERGSGQAVPLFPSRLRDVLQPFNDRLERPLRIVAAFGPRALSGKAVLQRAFDGLGRAPSAPGPKDGTPPAVGAAAGPAAVAFSLSWVPLDLEGAARVDLVRRWESEVGGTGE